MKIIVVYAMVMESHAKLLKVILTIPEEQVMSVCLFQILRNAVVFLITWSTGKLKKLYFLKLYRSLKEL